MEKSKSREFLWGQRSHKASNSPGALVGVGRGPLLHRRKHRAEDLRGYGTPVALALHSPSVLPELVGG